jgi:hypothetical protein
MSTVGHPKTIFSKLAALAAAVGLSPETSAAISQIVYGERPQFPGRMRRGFGRRFNRHAQTTIVAGICACEKPQLRWASRLQATPILENVDGLGKVATGRRLGKRVRAYVCQHCGKKDR